MLPDQPQGELSNVYWLVKEIFWRGILADSKTFDGSPTGLVKTTVVVWSSDNPNPDDQTSPHKPEAG